jgi:hypothetical protein
MVLKVQRKVKATYAIKVVRENLDDLKKWCDYRKDRK